MVDRARLALDDVDTQIEAVMKHFQERQAPMFWFLGPHTTPSDLGARLETRGLVYEGDDPAMAVELGALRPSLDTIAGLSIQQVRDAAALEHWVETFIVGYEIAGVTVPELLDVHAPLALGAHPPWRHYLDRLHGRPVATSWPSLGGGVAGIYRVATRPEARRQGLGAALTLAPLLDARAMGYGSAYCNHQRWDTICIAGWDFRTTARFTYTRGQRGREIIYHKPEATVAATGVLTWEGNQDGFVCEAVERPV